MRWMALALLGLFGCGLTLDLTPPVDGARPPVPDGGVRDAQTDAFPDAPSCNSDEDCADLAVGSCVSRCLPSGLCLLPDRDGDGVGPGCPDERDCDDNDPNLGTDGIRACDPGAGQCAVGAVQRCSDGSLGECQPTREPAADDATCDGFDDDCDGTIDENATTVGTGTDLCAPSYTCADGSWMPSTPAPTSTTDGCTPAGETPMDDDCDGTIDEDCAPTSGDCIFVRANPTSVGLTWEAATNPAIGAANVNAAIGFALEPGAPRRICLLAKTSMSGACEPTEFGVNVGIPGNMTILGNLQFNGSGVETCPGDDRTILVPPPDGLTVRGPRGTRVRLQDLAVAFPENPSEHYQAVHVTSDATLVLARVHVGVSDATPEPHSGSSRGVRVASGGTLIAMASRIEGGAANEAYGIDAMNADVFLVNSCGTSSCRPSCGGDSPAVRGGTSSTDGAAIRSEGGSLTVTRYAVCQGSGPKGIDAAGASVRILDSVVEVGDGSDQDILFGVHMRSCTPDTAHFIVGSEIKVRATSSSSPDGVAVRTERRCNLSLLNNDPIVGAASGSFDDVVGVSCDGSCTLTRNSILGVARTAEAKTSIAVYGDGNSTLGLQSNELRGSEARNLDDATGLSADGRSGRFARNRIVGGCATRNATGAVLGRGAYRVENNVLVGQGCALVQADRQVGLEVSEAVAILNGNTATGGVAPAETDCLSFGLLNDSSRSIFRNNVFTGGRGCTENVAVSATTLPMAFDHNGLTQGVFLDDDGHSYASQPLLLTLDPTYQGNVFTDAPQFLDYPTDLHIRATSPFANAGSPAGAPADDFDGRPRPRTPSMGAFEP